jgi:hypothetical protein
MTQKSKKSIPKMRTFVKLNSAMNRLVGIRPTGKLHSKFNEKI